MIKNPIVEEIRRIRDELSAKDGYDLDRIFKRLKEAQRRSGRKFVRLLPKKLTATPRHS